MTPRGLGWRDRLQIMNSALFLVLAIALAFRGSRAPSVPIFLMSGAFGAFAVYRFVWIWKYFRARKGE